MDPAPLLDRALDDEGLTAGLDEPEAGMLVRAVADRIRALAAATNDAALARRQAEQVCRLARQIGRAAAVFRDAGEPAARAATDRDRLPWPAGATTPGEVVRRLLPVLDRRSG